ncbi:MULTISPECIES: hypothetical protein [unclassified Streptomyces]|uniref:hypothetical protein n=1 Tax=unclassified Streptomyces TaxID=2593676 RepID=UPI003D8A94CC
MKGALLVPPTSRLSHTGESGAARTYGLDPTGRALHRNDSWERPVDAVTFLNGPITMAGNLYLPADFDPEGSYAAIVTVHPGGGVKEQTAGL